MSLEVPEAKPRILIVGGGIAGLEAALALADLAGDRARLSLLAPERDFVYKPLTVEEPFTGSRPSGTSSHRRWRRSGWSFDRGRARGRRSR